MIGSINNNSAVVNYAINSIITEIPSKPKLAPIPSNEDDDSQSVKLKAIARLLNNIPRTNLVNVCTSLGWSPSEEKPIPPEKYFIVAIVHTLIDIAKKYSWHLIRDAGFFYIYNGAYWITLDSDAVKQLVKNAAIAMGHTEIQCRVFAFVDKLYKQVEQDGFFSEKNIKRQSMINLLNGTLVLDQSGVVLKNFDHRDFLTHQLDFAYEPTAVNSLFLTYLEQSLPDADTRRTLQEMAGYLFVKGLKMEMVFFLFGTGSNGKSVFFEVLSGVIGKENISNYSLESLTDDKGYQRAMIKNKIVNYGVDIKLTKIDAGIFKTLASGEPVEARLPYEKPFIMDDYAKLVFNVNKMDSANIEHTHGFHRRLVVIPFNNTVPRERQDRDLHTKILANKAGVLNWIIEGAERVIKNRNIFVSEGCEAFKKQFIKETDSVAMFEEHIKDEMPGTRYNKTVKTAYGEYKVFCIDAGHRYPVGRTEFSRRMESLAFIKSKRQDGWYLEKLFN